jgi:sigma-54 dependent transcriptional regulator, acetoin dehydrogenase operon transcriptional activator AcoR
VVGPQGLPPQIRAAGRRNLSPLEEAEASVIARVLAESGWNKKLAAERLQIARGSLYQKMRRFRITGP